MGRGTDGRAGGPGEGFSEAPARRMPRQLARVCQGGAGVLLPTQARGNHERTRATPRAACGVPHLRLQRCCLAARNFAAGTSCNRRYTRPRALARTRRGSRARWVVCAAWLLAGGCSSSSGRRAPVLHSPWLSQEPACICSSTAPQAVWRLQLALAPTQSPSPPRAARRRPSAGAAGVCREHPFAARGHSCRRGRSFYFRKQVPELRAHRP